MIHLYQASFFFFTMYLLIFRFCYVIFIKKFLQNWIIMSIIIIYLYYSFIKINLFFSCSVMFWAVPQCFPDFTDGPPKSLGQFWLHTIKINAKKQNNSLLVVFLAAFMPFPEICQLKS